MEKIKLNKNQFELLLKTLEKEKIDFKHKLLNCFSSNTEILNPSLFHSKEYQEKTINSIFEKYSNNSEFILNLDTIEISKYLLTYKYKSLKRINEIFEKELDFHLFSNIKLGIESGLFSNFVNHYDKYIIHLMSTNNKDENIYFHLNYLLNNSISNQKFNFISLLTIASEYPNSSNKNIDLLFSYIDMISQGKDINPIVIDPFLPLFEKLKEQNQDYLYKVLYSKNYANLFVDKNHYFLEKKYSLTTIELNVDLISQKEKLSKNIFIVPNMLLKNIFINLNLTNFKKSGLELLINKPISLNSKNLIFEFRFEEKNENHNRIINEVKTFLLFFVDKVINNSQINPQTLSTLYNHVGTINFNSELKTEIINNKPIQNKPKI